MVARSVLVTGANRGIGLEFVSQLAKSTCEVVIATCRSPKDAKDLSALAVQHKNVRVVELDLGNFASYNTFAEEVGRLVGAKGLNVIVNNAGILLKTPTLESMTPDKFIDNFSTNTVAPLMLTKALLPLLKQASSLVNEPELSVKRAAIINISSDVGSMTICPTIMKFLQFKDLYSLPYNLSKASVNMLTRCLAIEFQLDGILVAAVHPGWVQTDMGSYEAALTTEQSVSAILDSITKYGTASSGGYFRYDGQHLPW